MFEREKTGVLGKLGAAARAGVLGVVAVAMPWPWNALALLGWSVASIRLGWTRDLSWGEVGVFRVGVLGTLVAAAMVAPGKGRGSDLGPRPVSLPREAMTLGELRAWLEATPGMPVRVRVSLRRSEEGEAVRWPSRGMTFGAFVGAIEAQTRLRLRVSDAGAGWTVLRGSDGPSLVILVDPSRPFP